jgi:hypothetical protein
VAGQEHPEAGERVGGEASPDLQAKGEAGILEVREEEDGSELTVAHLAAYQERFGKLPPYVVADQKYGTRDNREKLGGLEIRTSFKPLGRKSKETQKNDPWFKRPIVLSA